VEVVVSSNESVALFDEPDGCVKIADSTVAVSAAVSEINDNVTTAVAVSPAVIESVAESIVSVGAITAALVGSADITPKVIAAARPKAIFLNEFIFLLFYSVFLLKQKLNVVLLPLHEMNMDLHPHPIPAFLHLT
jgi:hypothetical protein